MLESLLEAQVNKKSSSSSCCPFLTVEFYKEYFDVKTSDVGFRLRSALFPFSSQFAAVTKEKPDLYGPFWIYTTLIFVLACAGNLSSYIAANFDATSQQKISLHFEFVPTAAYVVYGFGFVFPIVLAFVMKIFGSATIIPHVICVYGYSLTIFIPLSIACAYPSSFLQWILLIYGTVNSTIFLLLNFNRELKAYIPKSRFIILFLLIGAQIAVFLIFRLKFFSSIYQTVVDDIPDVIKNFGNSTTTST